MLQCQAAVKVPGSFRPVAGSEHLYSHCNFAESLVETVPESLRHSCRSELRLFPRLSKGDRLCLHLAQLIDDHVGIKPSLSARVHPLHDRYDLNQSSWLEMLTSRHRVAYSDEQLHVVLLRRKDRPLQEVWDHTFSQSLQTLHLPLHRQIARISSNGSASEVRHDLVKHLAPVFVLADRQ
jgi:hypothetical protein